MTDRPDPSGEKPAPPPADRRLTELPGTSPKPKQEDPIAPKLIEKIIECPNSLQADQDIGFLNRDDTRGIRLQLDYQKVETLLNEHGIAHSIVVFGSTRVPEPKAARQRIDDLEAQLDDDPGNADLIKALDIAKRVLDKSRYYDVAREFGRLVGTAEGRFGKRLVVVTGGGPGMMEAANRGASDAGARTVGFNITLPHEQYPNPYITPELCFRFHYFGMRKLHFLMRARALVVFPGGYGTMDELFETLTLIQTRKIAPLPVILVGKAYWQKVFDADFLVAEGVIDPEDRELFWYAETAEEIWHDIQRWYDLAGKRLTGEPDGIDQ